MINTMRTVFTALMMILAFIGCIAAAGVLVLVGLLMLRFLPVLIAIALAIFALSYLLNKLGVSVQQS
jgi:hypothetical protein